MATFPTCFCSFQSVRFDHLEAFCVLHADSRLHTARRSSASLFFGHLMPPNVAQGRNSHQQPEPRTRAAAVDVSSVTAGKRYLRWLCSSGEPPRAVNGSQTSSPAGRFTTASVARKRRMEAASPSTPTRRLVLRSLTRSTRPLQARRRRSRDSEKTPSGSECDEGRLVVNPGPDGGF